MKMCSCKTVKVILCSFDSDVLRWILEKFAKKQSFTNPSVFLCNCNMMKTASCPNQTSARVWLLTPYFLLPLFSDMHLSFDLKLTSRRSGASRLPAPTPRSGLSVPPSIVQERISAGLNFSHHQWRGKGGRGTYSLPKFPMLKNFSLNSAEFVTLNRISSMFIGFPRDKSSSVQHKFFRISQYM